MTAVPSDWITLARVVKTQGRKGELALDVLSDIPHRFDSLERVFLLSRSGTRQPVTITRRWPHKGWLILAFAEISDLNAAEPWVGAEVQLPRSERAPAPEGRLHTEDLIGCRVFDGNRLLGVLQAIEPVPGAADLLHVEDATGREVLIPFAAAYVRELAIPAGAIHLTLPDGLLDIE
ncbi:MAG: 16S rRNA processing protein RimM [Acidobacteria bacterium]|nr:MAG: 16S rRNA processing protein RimM [Acidobacteriota bacterium]